MSTSDSFRETVLMIMNRFPAQFNPHYDFKDPEHRAVIEAVEAYDKAFQENDGAYLKDAERKALGGNDSYQTGVLVESPWGDNKVISFTKGEEGRDDECVKEITVKPGFMLSLQRHRGRKELWEVLEGTLTVIKNGERIEIAAGKSITLDVGDIHCMNNAHDVPVKVKETQIGFCREADNVRLLDSNNRPVYPLKTKEEFQSARAYAALQAEIAQNLGMDYKPNSDLLVA